VNIIELFKKIFIPSYTDRKVQPLADDNIRGLEDATRSIEFHKKVMQGDDVAMKAFIASGGKNGH
jgi:hypothetical protein